MNNMMKSLSFCARNHLPLLRIGFGAYFMILFARMMPWAADMYSNQGVLADWQMNPTSSYVANLLYLWDSPAAVVIFLGVMVALSAAYMVGYRLRLVAVLMWLGWAMLWHRNVFTLNPSMPFNGFIMLATVFFPANTPWSVDRWLASRRDPERRWSRHDDAVPRDVWRVAWIVTAAAYTFSGWTKWISPGWRSGDALSLILDGPLARDVVWVDWMLQTPAWFLPALTLATVGAELLYAPLSLLGRRGRLAAWLSMVLLHIGLVGVIQFAELSLGMLLIHALTFDPAWVGLGRESKAARSGAGDDVGGKEGAWFDRLMFLRFFSGGLGDVHHAQPDPPPERLGGEAR